MIIPKSAVPCTIIKSKQNKNKEIIKSKKKRKKGRKKKNCKKKIKRWQLRRPERR